MANFLCIRTFPTLNDNDKLMEQIEELYNLCFSGLLNKSKFHGDPTKIVQMMNNIRKKSSQSQLKNIGPQEILPCSVKILFLCDDARWKMNKSCEFKRRKNYRIARDCYNDLLDAFIPEKMQEVMSLVIQTIHGEKFWSWEDLCYELIHDLLKLIGHHVVHYLLDKAMTEEDTSSQDATLIIRDLYEALKDYSWPDTHETAMVIERFLELYRSEMDIPEDSITKHGFLIRGLEVCIRNTIHNLSNDYLLLVIYRMCCWAVEEETNPRKIVGFASILEYACYTRKADSLENTLTNEIFPLVMQMIASSSELVSLLGNRVLQHLIDRKQNRSQFESPEIFFEDTKYNININEYNRRDKEFLKQHREVLHDTFVKSIMKHCSRRLNLECTYCTLCLMALEVPCGFTAAALVCLVMNVQDLTLGKPEMNRDISYHVHATVMAVLSFICCIHRAKVLYSYVNKVIMERAQWAPHLNPPLKAHYTFAVHYVLWDKPELFFVDWEVRFGLWKCFRLHTDKANRLKIT